MKSNIVAIIQARTNSTRLPRKVLKNLGERTLIEFLIERLKRVKELDQIILATTVNDIDDKLASLVKKIGLKVVRGSANDVLGLTCINPTAPLLLTALCFQLDSVCITALTIS